MQTALTAGCRGLGGTGQENARRAIKGGKRDQAGYRILDRRVRTKWFGSPPIARPQSGVSNTSSGDVPLRSASAKLPRPPKCGQGTLHRMFGLSDPSLGVMQLPTVNFVL